MFIALLVIGVSLSTLQAFAVERVNSCRAIFGTVHQTQSPGREAYNARMDRPRRYGPGQPRLSYDFERAKEVIKQFESSEKDLSTLESTLYELRVAAKNQYIVTLGIKEPNGEFKRQSIRNLYLDRDLYAEFGTTQFRGRIPTLSLNSIYGIEDSSGYRKIPASDIELTGVSIEYTPIPEWVYSTHRNSELADRIGLSVTHVLYHKPEKSILSILNAGYLGRPREQYRKEAKNQSTRTGNYLTPKRRDGEITEPWTLEFESKVFDRKDFFINMSWEYGEYHRNSIRFDETSDLRTLMYDASFRGSGAEIVVWSNIPTNHLKHIYVKSETQRRWLLKNIDSKKIQAPRGKSWNKIVVVISE